METRGRVAEEEKRSAPGLLLQVGLGLRAALVVDADGRIARMDAALARAAGLAGEPVEGRSASEVLQRLSWLEEGLEQALGGRKGVVTGDGARERLRALVFPVFDGDGRCLGACACLDDEELRVSEPDAREPAPVLRELPREDAEENEAWEHLEHTNSVLRATFDSITDGVVVVDLEGHITAFNRRFQDLWGLSDEVLLQRDSESALAAAAPLLRDPEAFAARIRSRMVPTDEVDVETIELKDGRILERASLPQRMGDAVVGRIWSYRDVTAERRAKAEQERLLAAEQLARERLVESFALLDTFLNHAPIGLGFLDRDLRYLRINDALASLHGRSREEELGRTVREMTPYMAPIIEPLMRQVLETGSPLIGLHLTGEVPATPGEQRHWRVSYYPVRTPLGGIVGLGVVLVEVTAERHAQAERERFLREAREAIRVRDDFLSIAAHELKTPLTPLKLHLQMLSPTTGNGDAPRSHHVDKALAQVRRLSALINDLLDTSRIQAGRLELRQEPVELRALTAEVVSEMRTVSPLHTIDYDDRGEPLSIHGDSARLAQVLTNLLENAMKYSATGCALRVSVVREGQEAMVAVEDHGIGIPEDQRQQLFERFFRASNAPISGYGGLGLGLYICRDIVERHGGRIWVESEVGRGSTFRFALPLVGTMTKR